MKTEKQKSQEEILRLVRRFTSTRRIDEALIPYFDQDGRWHGDKWAWRHAVWVESRARMTPAFLEPGRRVIRSASGDVLRTSFIWRNPGPLVLTHSRICGNLAVTTNTTIHAANLKQVDGSFYTRTRKWLYLPKLTKVDGDFIVRKSFLLRAPQLRCVVGSAMLLGHIPPQLETVGEDFGVCWMADFDAPMLSSVGGSLFTHHADEVHLPALQTVRRDFVASNPVRAIDAPLLESVGRDFLAESAVRIETPNLRSVARNLDSRNARNYFNPNIQVGGTWTTYPDDEIRYRARMRLWQASSIPIYI